jgi:NO-binding membrane sensor protein with MHYT domain
MLVVLSYLVSVLGSFTALQLAIDIPAARGTLQRWRAILGAGAAMGGGAVWAMHFIAMLACRMDIPVSYDLTITALSAGIGIASCMVGLAIASAGVFGRGKPVVAGLFMGLGVTGMHYTGMAAMLMPANIYYDQTLVLASAAIAVIASIVAMWLAFQLRGRMQMLGGGLVMGMAVCAVHYTAMQSASFLPNGQDVAMLHGLDGAGLGRTVFAVSIALLAGMLALSLIRQRQRASVRI